MCSHSSLMLKGMLKSPGLLAWEGEGPFELAVEMLVDIPLSPETMIHA